MVNQFGFNFGTTGGSSGLIQRVISLTGVLPSLLLTNKFGAFQLTISSTSVGHPILICDVGKRVAADALYMQNVLALPTGDTCALGITWNAGQSMYLSKSMASHDGVYIVTIIGKT